MQAAAFAEYARKKRERVRHGHEQAVKTLAAQREAGIACGQIPNVGYVKQWDGKRGEVRIDQETAPLALEAFALVMKGKSLRQILAILTPKGLVTRKGTPMHASSLRALLTNPFYCGMIRSNGELVQGQHGALISIGHFQRVQRKLTQGQKRESNRA